MVETSTGTGLTEAWHALVRDVYKSNLDRYEPAELGDSARTLGWLCSENLRTRAVRRFRHDDDEPAERHWAIDGLQVTTPQNALTFVVGQARVIAMKVPFSEGRSPRWDRNWAWEQDSQIRQEVAAENSHMLQYRSPAMGTTPLFPHPGTPGTVSSFLLLWAGEKETPLTAGWLAVPVLGETPFIAREPLWWDDQPSTQITTQDTPDRGPRFDQRPATTPAVTLKPQRDRA